MIIIKWHSSTLQVQRFKQCDNNSKWRFLIAYLGLVHLYAFFPSYLQNNQGAYFIMISLYKEGTEF